MKRLLSLILVIVISPIGLWATDAGLNFRADCSYPVDDDPSNTHNTCVQTTDLGAGDVTRDGVTFSATLPGNGGLANRDTGVDARLAGIYYTRDDSTQGVVKLVMDTSGSKDITLGIGDFVGAQGQQYVQIYDGDPSGSGTLLATINKSSVGQAHWYDASGVERTSSSDWVTNNVKLTLSFSTSNLYLKTGASSGSGTEYTVLAHVHAKDAAGVTYNQTKFSGTINVTGTVNVK